MVHSSYSLFEKLGWRLVTLFRFRCYFTFFSQIAFLQHAIPIRICQKHKNAPCNYLFIHLSYFNIPLNSFFRIFKFIVHLFFKHKKNQDFSYQEILWKRGNHYRKILQKLLKMKQTARQQCFSKLSMLIGQFSNHTFDWGGGIFRFLCS